MLAFSSLSMADSIAIRAVLGVDLDFWGVALGDVGVAKPDLKGLVVFFNQGEF